MRNLKFLFFLLLSLGSTYSILKQGVLQYEIIFLFIFLSFAALLAPHWAIYLLIIISPINLYIVTTKETLVFYSKEYFYIIVSTLFFLRILSRASERRHLKSPLTFPIVTFVFFMLIQAIRSYSPNVGAEGFKFYIQNISFFFFGLIFFKNTERIRDLISLTFITLVILSFLEIQKFTGRFGILWQADEAIRIGHLTTTISGTTFISSILCVLINCLAMAFVLRQKGIKQLLALVLSLIAIVAIFLSHTRGAYLSLLFSIVVMIYYSGIKFRLGLLITFLLILIIIFLVYFPSFGQRFISIYDPNKNVRFFIYSNSVKALIERGLLLFGSGLFTHDLVGLENWTYGAPEPIFFDNLALILLAEAGIGVVILLSIIFFRFLKNAKEIYTNLKEPFLKNLSLGIITMWVTLFFSMVIGTTTWLNVPTGMFFWLFAGVMFNLPEIDDELSKKDIVIT